MTPEQEAVKRYAFTAVFKDGKAQIRRYLSKHGEYVSYTAYDEQAREIERLREICDAFKTEFAERYRIDVDARLREIAAKHDAKEQTP